MSNNKTPWHERFQALREAKGWTFAEAAVAFKVSESAWRKWETEDGNASPIYKAKLERMLKAVERA